VAKKKWERIGQEVEKRREEGKWMRWGGRRAGLRNEEVEDGAES
jgi:hypothetical protein